MATMASAHKRSQSHISEAGGENSIQQEGDEDKDDDAKPGDRSSPSLQFEEGQINEQMFKKTNLSISPSSASAIDFNSILQKNIASKQNLMSSKKLFQPGTSKKSLAASRNSDLAGFDPTL